MKNLSAVLCILILVLGPYPAYALPTGANVVQGSATINTTGNTLTITNSNGAVIDWNSFSIGAGEVTRFIQPSASSTVLNRVTGGNISSIYGSLESNGQVVLINPAGIMIGSSGVIDTNGFVGSTLDISNAQFLAGDDLNFVGDSSAAIVNLGKISAMEGDVFLLARQIQNCGCISATEGTAGLLAGGDIILAADGTQAVRVGTEQFDAEDCITGIENSATVEAAKVKLEAAGGNLYSLAIKNCGTIRATGTSVIDGVVHFTSEQGAIEHNGIISAQNADGSGGEIYLGGDREGDMNRSDFTIVSQSAQVDASGAGGHAEVWSEKATFYQGNTVAGKNHDAGFIEISSKGYLGFDGEVDAGIGGTILFDPKDIHIVCSGGLTEANLSCTGKDFFCWRGSICTTTDKRILFNHFEDTPHCSHLTSSINASAIEAILNLGANVRLEASNDLKVLTNINVNSTAPSGNGGDLALYAGRSINIGCGAPVSINTDNGNLQLIANAGIAFGVQNLCRDPGCAEIRMACGSTINTGSGSAAFFLRDGLLQTNNGASTIALTNVNAKNMSIHTFGCSNVCLSGTFNIGNQLGIRSKGFVTQGASSSITANEVVFQENTSGYGSFSFQNGTNNINALAARAKTINFVNNKSFRVDRIKRVDNGTIITGVQTINNADIHATTGNIAIHAAIKGDIDKSSSPCDISVSIRADSGHVINNMGADAINGGGARYAVFTCSDPGGTLFTLEARRKGFTTYASIPKNGAGDPIAPDQVSDWVFYKGEIPIETTPEGEEIKPPTLRPTTEPLNTEPVKTVEPDSNTDVKPKTELESNPELKPKPELEPSRELETKPELEPSSDLERNPETEPKPEGDTKPSEEGPVELEESPRDPSKKPLIRRKSRTAKEKIEDRKEAQNTKGKIENRKKPNSGDEEKGNNKKPNVNADNKPKVNRVPERPLLPGQSRIIGQGNRPPPPALEEGLNNETRNELQEAMQEDGPAETVGTANTAPPANIPPPPILLTPGQIHNLGGGLNLPPPPALNQGLTPEIRANLETHW